MKYLGIDWGLKRVGLAVSEGDLATPLKTLTIHGLEDGVEKIMQMVNQEGADLLVIGFPEGEMGRLVEKLAIALQKRGINFKLVDETLSTQGAKKVMLEMGVGKKERQQDNAVSAAIILQRFIDEKL